MRARLIFPLFLVFLTMSAAQASAEEVVLRERLARLEEGQRGLRELTDKRFDDMNRRFDDMNDSMNRRFDDMNRRFDDMNDSMNRRFDDMNRRFDDLRFWLQIILGVLVVIIGGLAAQLFLMWRRIIGLESVVAERATEVDQVLADQKKETAKVDLALVAQKKEATKLDRVLADQKKEIEELKMRLGALEAKLAG